MAQTVKRLPTMWETQVQSLVRKILWRRKWQPTPVLLPGKSHGWRSMVGYSPWSRKELDKTKQLHFLFFNFSLSKFVIYLSFTVLIPKRKIRIIFVRPNQASIIDQMPIEYYFSNSYGHMCQAKNFIFTNYLI